MTMMAEEVLGLDIADFEDVPGCQCGTTRGPCLQPAVANVHLQHACTEWGCALSFGAHGWVLMCDVHRNAARDKALKCGICGTPDGYLLLAEVPL